MRENSTTTYTSLSEPDQCLSSDEAIQRVGGFSRYQCGMVLVMIITCSLPGHISYIIAFLQNRDIPTIICHDFNGTSSVCDQKQACNSTMTKFY